MAMRLEALETSRFHSCGAVTRFMRYINMATMGVDAIANQLLWRAACVYNTGHPFVFYNPRVPSAPSLFK